MQNFVSKGRSRAFSVFLIFLFFFAGSAFADGDVSSLVSAATAEIEGLKAAVITIGVILIGIAAVVGAVFLIKGSVKRI